MSNRRHLVQGSRNTQEATASPARTLQRNSHGGGQQSNTELPPYQPLECALTPSAREQLERLKNTHDHTKYKKHIKSSILAVTEAATSGNDRLTERKAEAQKRAERREKEGRYNEEPTQEEKEDADYLKTLSRKVKTMTQEIEIALRELIDYDDELAMFTNRLEDVIATIGDAPAPRPARARAQRADPDEDGDSDDPDEEEPEEEVPVIAPSDMYKKALGKYETEYRSKSMRAR
jgi:ribosomal protein L12E/L44/L45/RPP1/RPP2